MIDPVRVRLASGMEQTVESSYAKDNKLEVLKDEPVYAHGRLRGPSRKNGRPLLPETDLSSAIPTPTPGDKAGGQTKE